MGTETPQRPRKEAAGSRHEPGLVRQTAPASTDPIGPQTQTLLEEGLRRENRRTALTRVQSNKGAPGVDGMRVEERACVRPRRPAPSPRGPRSRAGSYTCGLCASRGAQAGGVRPLPPPGRAPLRGAASYEAER